MSNYGITEQEILRRFYGVLEYSRSILNQLLINNTTEETAIAVAELKAKQNYGNRTARVYNRN